MQRRLRVLLAVSAVATLVACGDHRIAPGEPEGDADTTLADAALPDAGGIDAAPDVAGDTGAGDVGAPDSAPDAATPDAVGGGIGEACEDAADCASGFCVAGPAGSVCSASCDDGSACPDGWDCHADPTSGATICAPRFTWFCRPCADDADCTGGLDSGDGCMDLGEAGSFCGISCDLDADCPKDTACQDVTLADGSAGRQCAPTSGECSCNALAVEEQAGTACSVTNEHGTCEGIRSCTDEGLSACDAATAQAEICNGLDDDCDGETDEGAGGDPCAIENESGTCVGTDVCSGGELLCEGDAPAPESCNGLDDDCDGETDEGFSELGQPCDGPDTDECANGIVTCTEDGAGVECGPESLALGVELCNGKDDDCDGSIDEDFPTLGEPCDGPDGDLCSNGVIACAPGGGTQCGSESPADIAELCNGLDDDCDSAIDEGFPLLGTGCDGPDDDECATGTWVCAGSGASVECIGDEAPSDEVCDGVDNDCDGQIDEGCAPTSVMATFGSAGVSGQTGALLLKAGVGLAPGPRSEAAGAAFSVQLGVHAASLATP